MNTQLDCLALGELRTNAKGGKTASISQHGGKPVIITATVPLQCPFGASLFQDDGTSTRLNIDFAQLEGLEAIFRGIDEQLILAAIVAKDSLWVGEGLTEQQIRDNYSSPLKEREGYSTTLRAKLDTENVVVGVGREPRFLCQNRRAKAAKCVPKFSCRVCGL
jgi:hypothetical protein